MLGRKLALEVADVDALDFSRGDGGGACVDGVRDGGDGDWDGGGNVGFGFVEPAEGFVFEGDLVGGDEDGAGQEERKEGKVGEEHDGNKEDRGGRNVHGLDAVETESKRAK